MNQLYARVHSRNGLGTGRRDTHAETSPPDQKNRERRLAKTKRLATDQGGLFSCFRVFVFLQRSEQQRHKLEMRAHKMRPTQASHLCHAETAKNHPGWAGRDSKKERFKARARLEPDVDKSEVSLFAYPTKRVHDTSELDASMRRRCPRPVDGHEHSAIVRHRLHLPL